MGTGKPVIFMDVLSIGQMDSEQWREKEYLLSPIRLVHKIHSKHMPSPLQIQEALPSTMTSIVSTGGPKTHFNIILSLLEESKISLISFQKLINFYCFCQHMDYITKIIPNLKLETQEMIFIQRITIQKSKSHVKNS